MKKRFKFPIQAWGILLFLILAVSPVLSKEKKIFSIGWDQWIPYQHINDKGQLVGLDVELVQAIFQKMDVQLEYKEVPWKQLLPAVKRGQISLAAGASKSVERKSYAYFSDPYRLESVVLFIRKGELKSIKQISDITHSDLIIGILSGNYYGKNFEKLMSKESFRSHVQIVTDDLSNIKKTLNKRIDGFLCDKYAGISAINKAGAYNRFDIHPVPISSSDIHVMFSKKTCQPFDVQKFNEALSKLKKNGTLNQIIRKYFQ